MAKMNVTVDNKLDEIELESSEKLNPKKKIKKVKTKKETLKKQGYLKQVGKEMRLVTWPSRKDVVRYSFATIVMIVVLAIFFVGLSALFDLLYGLVQGWIG